MSAVQPLLPMFLKVAGKRAVVVGAGPIGLHKAADLAAAGACVTVIALSFSDDVALGGQLASIERVQRAFAPGDTKGAFVVFAATGVVDVDDAVSADARDHGALVNVVDRADASDFYSGAVVRRGPLTVVVGTSGASPALARKVRERIEQLLPPTLGVLAEVLGEARPKLLARFPNFGERARVLDTFVERAWFRFVTGPTPPQSFASGDDVRSQIARAVEEELLCT